MAGWCSGSNFGSYPKSRWFKSNSRNQISGRLFFRRCWIYQNGELLILLKSKYMPRVRVVRGLSWKQLARKGLQVRILCAAPKGFIPLVRSNLLKWLWLLNGHFARSGNERLTLSVNRVRLPTDTVTIPFNRNRTKWLALKLVSQKA